MSLEPPDTNVAPKYVISCAVLAAVAFGLCAARIYTRAFPVSRLGIDDYLIGIAEILSLAGYCAAAAAAGHGWGHLSIYVSAHNQMIAYKCLFILQLLWIIALPLVRISIALSLLRFSNARSWRWTLWALISVQVVITTGWLVVLFFSCRPLRSNWETVADVVCWDRKYTIVYGWVSAALLVLIDLTLALMPIKLIRTLNRPFREKVLVSCLMMTGLLATIIACIKMTTFKIVDLGDPLQATVEGSLWAKLEELVGIIAACLPCLKSPAERLLRRLGILSDRYLPNIPRPSFVVSFSGPMFPLTPVREEMNRDIEASDSNLVGSQATRWKSGTSTSARTLTANTEPHENKA
ncbi:uncharacterized protein LY89DRAFT_592935 [Mollisia scopiformis]|uniref:Rhodopsin domain-containing protein n=1 Tax=Mollisia scopiformis TaxID=149040 RepID=A0A194WY96_MOLSC|nr:uncharacterized protein LY89DRAFT_592935 [Mollisia scopiformis]KUJ12659.1 hypothetical protein LY89DRAFT_592935 [Mollisia scopiformis]